MRSLFMFVEGFNDYNDWKRKRQKAPYPSSPVLKQHSTALFSVIASPYTAQWGSFRNDIEFLAISLNSYAEFLDYSTEE